MFNVSIAWLQVLQTLITIKFEHKYADIGIFGEDLNKFFLINFGCKCSYLMPSLAVVIVM